MGYSEKSHALILAVLFGFVFCSKLLAQQNCTVCKAPMQLIGGALYCPNCNPEKFGATAMNAPAKLIYDYLSVLPVDVQEGFAIRLSLSEKEEDLIAEIKEKAQEYNSQESYLKPAKIMLSKDAQSCAEKVVRELRRVGDELGFTTEGQEEVAPQDPQLADAQKLVLSIIMQALMVAGATEVRREAIHDVAAGSNMQVLGQITVAALDPSSFMINTLGLTSLFGTNTEQDFSEANIQSLSEILLQGDQIQVVMTMDNHPFLVGTLMPDPHHDPSTPPDQQGAHLLLGNPVFVTFNQVGPSILSLLEAFTKETQGHKALGVHFFKRAPQGALFM